MSNSIQKGDQLNSFEKDYFEITKDYPKLPNQDLFVQWSTPGDFFTKFSLYPEKSSTTTSSGTAITKL